MVDVFRKYTDFIFIVRLRKKVNCSSGPPEVDWTVPLWDSVRDSARSDIAFQSGRTTRAGCGILSALCAPPVNARRNRSPQLRRGGSGLPCGPISFAALRVVAISH